VDDVPASTEEIPVKNLAGVGLVLILVALALAPDAQKVLAVADRVLVLAAGGERA
jgi:hypothetical protein